MSNRTTCPAPAATFTTETNLADLATTHAGASRVFTRHGLDFCCHGQQSIAAACRRRGIDPQQVLAELRAELQPLPAGADWPSRPTRDLIAHLLDTYHAGHRAELPRLQQMATRVERVHAGKAKCPVGLAAQLQHVAESLEQHMQKEEQVLFPMLLAGHGGSAEGPIEVMESEHEEHGRNLARLRQLTQDFTPPADACGTWRALYLGLAEFERDVMEHIHLENHVLFPRALRG